VCTLYFLYESTTHSNFFTDVSEKRVVKRLVKRLKVDLDLSVQHEELTELLNDDDANAMQVFLFERYTQCIKAKRVFEMLDEADKGVVVVQDLQRVADEIFEGDESLSESDLQEMMDLVDESGDGLLTKENLIQIAQMVGL
jgi:Ca2+-binding EF-hand superfamily protein